MPGCQVDAGDPKILRREVLRVTSGAASEVEHPGPLARAEPGDQFVEKTRGFPGVPVRVQFVIVDGVKPGGELIRTLRPG
jgi:hypothetical protein